MIFGAFSRPNRVEKKYKTFFQTLGALSLKGSFFFGAFSLKEHPFTKIEFAIIDFQRIGRKNKNC